MSVSMYTAIVIQTSEVRCGASRGLLSNSNNETYQGEIWVMKEGKMHSLLLSTKPTFEFASDAIHHMEDLVSAIRKIDLTA